VRNSFFIIGFVVLSASSVSAQQLREQKPDKRATSVALRPAKTAANPCAAYGAGFVRIEGSSTCIKIGGSIDVGVGGPR
jgi:hypothetical protein